VKTSFDAIVVGAGVTGCAAARALAKCGQRVLLLERRVVGHDRGSSHGRARIARLAYPDPAYVALCKSAYLAWRELEAESGEALLQVTGGLDIALAPSQSLRDVAAALSATGTPFEFLDRMAIATRFPQFVLPARAVAVFQRDAGVLHADRCLAALVASALRHGAELRENEAVRDLAAHGATVTVTTDHARYRADRLVLAAGPQMRPLAQTLGLDLPLIVSKEQVAYFQPPESEAFAPARFPVFILHLGKGLLGSGFPLIRDHGLKIMIEDKTAADPEDFSVDASRLRQVNEVIRPLLPGLGAAATQAETCSYTLTPDGDFIIDRHPQHRQIIVASPCSGHGFKFAPLLGQAIADLAAGNAPAVDISPFRLDRPGLRVGYQESINA
jgi:sarcosine oxidase